MLLYHGCASYRQASKEGLIYDPNRANDFGEGEYLQSCGGTYLSDSIEVAAFYADNATNSEVFMGDDPCVFAVEVDGDLLLADEDKVWDAMRAVVERALGRRLWDETDAEDAHERIDALFARNGRAIEEWVADKFRLSGEVRDTIEPAVRAFLLRATCYDWSVVQPGFEAELTAINEFCSLASGTISHGWLSEHYDTFVLTCRTLTPITTMGSDGPARIVGSIRLVMGDLGLSVQAIEFDGEFSEEDALDFEGFYIQKAQERAGCEIAPFDVNSISPMAA